MKNKKLISILCACSLLFIITSKSCSMFEPELESKHVTQESYNTPLSKSNIPTQEYNESELESNITATESNSISIWEIGKITSKIAGWISGYISGISLLTVVEIINRSRKGEWDRNGYDFYFGPGAAILCPISGLVSYGAFKLAKYFDSKEKNLQPK